MLTKHELATFLGLQDGIGIQMAPDYRLSLLDTIIMRTRAIINHTQSLAIFESLYRYKSSDSEAITYPSWAPDFLKFEYTESFIGFEAAKYRKHVNEDRAEFRALFVTMLDGLALNEPSDLAQWTLFQATFAEGATCSPFVII